MAPRLVAYVSCFVLFFFMKVLQFLLLLLSAQKNFINGFYRDIKVSYMIEIKNWAKKQRKKLKAGSKPKVVTGVVMCNIKPL